MAIKRQFLVSFMVDARGGAMRGCRHSGVRVIIPPRKAAMPMRITCRYLKKDKLVHAPPLMEGEALASRILEMGPSGAKFLGPVIIEVPHFASLRGKEREIVILRSDNGETWREHTLEATEEAVQEVLNESFDGEELKQLEDLNTNRITRILTTDFPQYFAIVTRIRQEVHAIGPEGGMVSSTVVPQVQAVFPQGALTKKIKVGLQAQPISTELVAKLLGNRVAVSPIVTVEPRRRKFHKPITLTIPVPQAASKGMINQYSGEAPTLRLLCSITGGTTRAQWEDVTGSTPLTFVNDCVSFTTTVSARFWLMDCTNIPEATKMATELYREAIHVPFMAKFVVFSKRHAAEEARVRVFCMTDDKEDKTLETQEHFIEVAKSRDVEVLEGKTQYLEFAGNLIPVTKSGDQLAFNFYAFRENRLPFTVRVKDPNAESVGRVAFMRQPKVGRGDAPQSPICNLNLSLPDNIQPEPAPSEPDLLALEKKYAFLSISKTDTIHKADLRLSDISNMLAGDWVALAKEIDVSDSDINIIKSQYPDNIPQQAIVMLRLWMQTSGNKATGNTLEKALRTIHRDDIVDECICNLEEVTDDRERAMAKERLDRPLPFDETDLVKDSGSGHEVGGTHRIMEVPTDEAEGVNEMEIVPEPRSSTIHETSQVVVESFEKDRPEDIVQPVHVEEVTETKVEAVATHPVPAEEEPHKPSSESERGSDVEEVCPPEVVAASDEPRVHFNLEEKIIIPDEEPHSPVDYDDQVVPSVIETTPESLESQRQAHFYVEDDNTFLPSAPEEELLTEPRFSEEVQPSDETESRIQTSEVEHVHGTPQVVEDLIIQEEVVKAERQSKPEVTSNIPEESFRPGDRLMIREEDSDQEGDSEPEGFHKSESLLVHGETPRLEDLEIREDLSGSDGQFDEPIQTDVVFGKPPSYTDLEKANDLVQEYDPDVEPETQYVHDMPTAVPGEFSELGEAQKEPIIHFEERVMVTEDLIGMEHESIPLQETSESKPIMEMEHESLPPHETLIESKPIMEVEHESLLPQEILTESKPFMETEHESLPPQETLTDSKPLLEMEHESLPPQVVSTECKPLPEMEHEILPPQVVSTEYKPLPEMEHESLPPQVVSTEYKPLPEMEHESLPPQETLPESKPLLVAEPEFEITSEEHHILAEPTERGEPEFEITPEEHLFVIEPTQRGEPEIEIKTEEHHIVAEPEFEITPEDHHSIVEPTDRVETEFIAVTEDSRPDSQIIDELDEAATQERFTQPSGDGTQMVQGGTAPSDVKPLTQAAGPALTDAPPSDRETGDFDSTVRDDTYEPEDVGVVFTERKESGDGEKLPTETKGGHITTQTTTTTTYSSTTSSSPTLQSQDDSRPQKRHERTFSQASNVVSTTTVVHSESAIGEDRKTGDIAIENDVKPYSERKQFWESVTSQSFENKSPVGKSETESDTDTGTDGTVIEKSEKATSSVVECSDSDPDSSQRRDPSLYESVTFRTKKPSESSGSKDLPSPDDMSLKDVKTKKEMFEKEIKRQSSEIEESNGWKRSSKELDEEPTSDIPTTSTYVKETVTISSDITAVNETLSKRVESEQHTDSSVLKTLEKTDSARKQSSELTKEGKLKYEKTITDDTNRVTEKETSSKEDSDKEIKDDKAKVSFKSVEEKDDGSVVKTKVKEASKVHVSHEQLEGKSETIVTDYDREKGETSRHEQSSTSSVDFKESTSSNVIRSEVKFGLGTTSQLSSTDTTDSTNGSFERSDSTKESFDKTYSASGTLSSSSKKQSTLTSSSGDDHDVPEFPEDSSGPELPQTSDNRLVEKKIEEERRKFGDTEELLVREITTTREGGQEQRVIKETKTQETLMTDGSTVKTTSVTTFTTQLDRGDSEDTVEHSEESASSATEREKSEVLLKQQIKADMFAEGMHEKSDELSPERKLLSLKESKKVAFDAPDTSLASPIHVPEENVQEIVWEVFQEQSEVPVSETVEYIKDEDQEPSEDAKGDSKEEPKKIILTEEEARGLAEEIVEEVKTEALKRSPIYEKDVIINRVEIEHQPILPKQTVPAPFTTETSDKIEKYIQERLTGEKIDSQHLDLIESVAAKKTQMLQKRLGTQQLQLSLEITDEDLKSSSVDADLSPIERQMERLRQMTEDDDQVKSGREPSEADESESSLIIHEAIEDSFTTGYDQANEMFNKTLDTVKSVSLKGERVISTIPEDIDEGEKLDDGKEPLVLEKRKKSREELTEVAIEIVKEVTDIAKESSAVKQVMELSKTDDDQKREPKKTTQEDLKHERSLDIPMESSMTESVEECSAAESTRAYDTRFVTEITKSSIQEVAENGQEKKPSGKLTPPTEEIRLRKKTHIDEFNRRSGTDLDAYSSSGESHYFTAGESTDSRSVSRPCSSDVEMLLSATPGTSEYDTALTSQDGSSRDFSTAPSSISSRDSMKSIDSESSGHLGSNELSEASETLVPSTLDLEKDMEILDKELLEEELSHPEEKSPTVIPQLTIQSGTPKAEDIPSPFETETDDMDEDIKNNVPYVSSKMKRSVEMTFHPEPKVLKGGDDDYTQIGLEESTISDMSVITVLEKEQGVLESSTSDTNMTSSNISDQITAVETRDASTEHTSKPEDEGSRKKGGTTTSVTITATTVPPSHPDDPTASRCTQVTSEESSEKSDDDSFFRANGPTEVEYVKREDDTVNAERLADAPVCSDDERLGATGGHSVGPDSSFVESFEPEADQEYGRMIREGEDPEQIEAEIQQAIDSQPEDDMESKHFSTQGSIERPKTPEPGSFSKLRIKTSQDSEELTEVDKRFSAIFSVTYEEPASPAQIFKRGATIDIVPNITITEHMAPIDNRYRYPDLECEEEFPEIRTNGIESGSHSTPSSVTSPKSSTTDSEHGREYCLDSQTEGPVQYSDYGSFELIEAADIQDITEFQNTLIRHEQRLRDMTIKEEDEVSSQGSKKEESPVLPPTTIKAIKLDSESPSSSGDGDISRSVDEPGYSSSIEEQRRWLEMQFEENAGKTTDDFPQQPYEHVFSGPLEDIEEERDEYERRDLSHLTKTPSLSSTPEYDVLAGRKFFTRSGDQDDISMSSLQEFEKFEQEMSIESATRRSSSGSQESLNGKRPGSGNKSHGDDVSVSSFSSLNEFERLEKECMLVEQVETKVKSEEQILSEIEEGHESQVSESESCETVSDPGRESPDNYEAKIFEIDEIIRQAQTNVEQFEKEIVPLRDIVGLSPSTGERTPSAEPPDSLEEPLCTEREVISAQQAVLPKKEERSPDGMATSSDSLDSKHSKDVMISSLDSLEDIKKRQDPMSASIDSIESAKRDLMITSADSLGRDDSSGREGDVSSESDRVSHLHGGIMEGSTDSFDPTSSQATHATYQYETDSVMSGSFTSGCSTTLVQSTDEITDLMSASVYIPEDEPIEESHGVPSSMKYEWMKVRPEGTSKKVVQETSEPGYSKTITRTVALPPDVREVTFSGPDAKEKLKQFMEEFNTGEHSTETETVDKAGNIHVQKVVQKRIVMDPAFAEGEGLIESEPKIEESVSTDDQGNVTRIVRRTVISTHTVEIDLDTGEPIIRRESSPVSTSSHSTSSTTATQSFSPHLSSHLTGPPSGSHSPREPLPTSLEPNTASGGDESEDHVQKSYGDLSDDDDADPSLITITDPTPPLFVTTTTSSTSHVTTYVDPSGGAKTTVVTTRVIEGRTETDEERSEMNNQTMDDELKKI